MATLGEQLKAARQAKGVTESEAGDATKILRRLIAAMERDDFSDMPAPTYAKGFIRMYARYLGLDPEPLVQEYLDRHTGQPAPSAKAPVPSAKAPVPSGTVPAPVSGRPPAFSTLSALSNLGSWFSKTGRTTGGVIRRIQGASFRDVRVIASAVAGLLVLIILAVSISNCARRRGAAIPEAAPAAPLPAGSSRLLINEPVPELYLVEPGKIESR